ncbi:hypothetical protein HDU96_001764 [Phlyctochytrium bullatum]|nr:hypothetical protein HDU96_001764 [Phlyctochytrium bullatum]
MDVELDQRFGADAAGAERSLHPGSVVATPSHYGQGHGNQIDIPRDVRTFSPALVPPPVPLLPVIDRTAPPHSPSRIAQRTATDLDALVAALAAKDHSFGDLQQFLQQPVSQAATPGLLEPTLGSRAFPFGDVSAPNTTQYQLPPSVLAFEFGNDSERNQFPFSWTPLPIATRSQAESNLPTNMYFNHLPTGGNQQQPTQSAIPLPLAFTSSLAPMLVPSSQKSEKGADTSAKIVGMAARERYTTTTFQTATPKTPKQPSLRPQPQRHLSEPTPLSSTSTSPRFSQEKSPPLPSKLSASPDPPEVSRFNSGLPEVHLSKSSVAKDFACRTCTRNLGILIFYGSPQELDDPVAIDVDCAACAGADALPHSYSHQMQSPEDASPLDGSKSPEDPGSTGSPGTRILGAPAGQKKRRLKGVGRDMVIVCEACNTRIGFGGVRADVPLPAAGPRAKSPGSEGKSRSAASGEWQETRASVEPICEWCVTHFALKTGQLFLHAHFLTADFRSEADFCTQCGGGGTYRTGKWRPRQLFAGKRKTCVLSHERLGALPHFQVTSYELPVNPIQDVFGAVVDQQFDPRPIIFRADSTIQQYQRQRTLQLWKAVQDGDHAASELLAQKRGVPLLISRREEFAKASSARFMAIWATPLHMANADVFHRYDKLARYVDARLKELRVLMGEHPLAVQMEAAGPLPSPTTHRRYMSVVDALRPRKELAEVPPRTEGRGRPPSTAKRGNVLPGVVPFPTQVVGYFFVEWNVPGRHLQLQHMRYEGRDAPDDDPARSPLPLLSHALSLRIHADAQTLGIPEPLHVWCLSYRARPDTEVKPRHVAQLEKLGYLPLPEYCQKCGLDVEEMRRSMVSSTMPADIAEEMEVIVQRWEEIKGSAVRFADRTAAEAAEM